MNGKLTRCEVRPTSHCSQVYTRIEKAVGGEVKESGEAKLSKEDKAEKTTRVGVPDTELSGSRNESRIFLKNVYAKMM